MPRLNIAAENTSLRRVAKLEEFFSPLEQAEFGRSFLVDPPGAIQGENYLENVAGRLGGDSIPETISAQPGRLRAGAELYRAKDVLYAPEYGAVVNRMGVVYRASVDEALFISPTLARLPFATVGDASDVELLVPADIPSIPRGSVFLAWGGYFNYGHFIIDCLTTLLLEDEAGALENYPALVPAGLAPWHYQLIDLTIGAGNYRIIQSPVIALDDALFASPMAHFLHQANATLARLRRRILGNMPNPEKGTRKIYFSRRTNNKRLMINEAELEARLAAKGFEILRPEHMSIIEQISAMAGARVVVGATGAAFANCLFMSPGGLVIEIQPLNFIGIWVRALCDEVDLRWAAFFCQSPIHQSEFNTENVVRPGAFSYELPMAEFLMFLDHALAS